MQMSPEVMEKEGAAAPPEDLTFDGIHTALDAQLHTFQITDASEICQLLHREPKPLNLELCATYVKAKMIELGRSLTPGQRSHAAREVLNAYPDEYLMEPLPTPRQYCKENDLNGTVRANLRTVFSTTVDESRKELSEDFEAGDFEDCGLGLSDEEIMAYVQDFVEGRDDELRQQVDYIKEIFPEKEPSSSLTSRIGGIVLRRDERPEAIKPKTSKEAGLIESALFRLKQLLEQQLNQSEADVADLICAKLEPALTERLSDHFRGIYDELASEYASELGTDVEEAFHAARGKDKHISLSERLRLRQEAEDDQTEPEEEVSADQATETTDNGLRIIKLGETTVDLGWAEGDTFEVSLMRENGNALMFLTAMSPKAGSISEAVRKQKADAAIFDRLWRQARQIELSNARGVHPYIDNVKNISRSSLKDLLVLKFGNLQHNAKRVYYAKTTVDRYAPLANMIEGQGLESNLPLLIRIGETDKAHQIQLYGDFGITRPRAHGVGSV